LAQDCAGPPDRLCQIANSDDEIFTARVLSKMDEDGTIRVQVLHLYRGTASGKISVAVSPLYQKFREGETYLFFTESDPNDPDSPRSNELCMTEPASSVPTEELALLKSLSHGPNTGSIFGALSTTENLAYMNRLTGITVHFDSKLEKYSVVTDEGGEFEIPKVQPGVYHVSADLPDTLRMSEDENIAVFPHGCMSAYLLAVNNSSISGQITLPPGVKVNGALVRAVNLSSYSDGIANADSQGRYEMVGLEPGEYVIGIIKDPALRIGALITTTYFPGTANLQEAKKFVIIGPNRFTNVDIKVPAASTDQSNVGDAGILNLLSRNVKEIRIVEVRIAVNFPDGTPAENASVDISAKSDEYNFGSDFHTGKQGEITLHIPANVAFQVSASFVKPSMIQCTSQQLSFNTEDGSWKSLAASKDPIRLVLSGPECNSLSH
jgi:protocatechuate 3,4-dioxygenase beta subunit